MVVKLRIAVLIDAWFPFQGGGQVHVRETTKLLRQDYGYTIKIFGGFAPTLWARFLWDFLVIPQVIWYHLKHPFHLIHAHAYSAGVSGKILSWLFGIPVIFTVHGNNTLDIAANRKLRQLTRENSLSFRLKYWLERWFLTGIRYDAVITVAKNFLNYPNVNKLIFVIPNGANVGKLKAQNSKRKITTKKSKLTFLFVGRLEKIKGVDLLLRIMAEVKDQLPEFELRIVGSGSEEKNLQDLMQRMVLCNQVKFLGEVLGNKLAKEYSQADLFVLPSLTEGQPLTVLEAWANQTPVLVTKVGQNPKMVKEVDNGFLVEPGSREALKNGLLKAVRNRQDWHRMGRNGYTLVKTRYTWEETTRKIVKVYKIVITGGNHAA